MKRRWLKGSEGDGLGKAKRAIGQSSTIDSKRRGKGKGKGGEGKGVKLCTVGFTIRGLSITATVTELSTWEERLFTFPIEWRTSLIIMMMTMIMTMLLA